MECLQVLTSKSMAHLKRLGGTASWSIDPSRVKGIQWVVCFRIDPSASNRHVPFLIGEIGPIIISPEWDRVAQRNVRYLIKFERVAVINDSLHSQCVNWRQLAKGRNPIRYGNVQEVFNGQSLFESLEFISAKEWRGEYIDQEKESRDAESLDLDSVDLPVHSFSAELNHAEGISVDQAKELLASKYKVPVNAIEIKITF